MFLLHFEWNIFLQASFEFFSCATHIQYSSRVSIDFSHVNMAWRKEKGVLLEILMFGKMLGENKRRRIE